MLLSLNKKDIQLTLLLLLLVNIICELNVSSSAPAKNN